MRELDAINRQILSELRADARVSLARLGAMVHLSRNAVSQRIRRLERDEHILGYTISERHPGEQPRVSATLLIDRHDRVRGVDVITAIDAIPEVVLSDVVTGELDLIVRVEAADPERLREVWTMIAALPGVRNITTAMSLRTTTNRRF
ncbi:Lrp/AsnC family transcriptional regulator [Microbacterium sp. NPDC058342]|uniref:Lrp/AsnC family transcriptional regulator n=1 Tax=Microbacterium sp. NPDC058342 TaxID=3346454 RepID=UPI0036585ADE